MASAAEVPEGGALAVEAGGIAVALFKVGGRIYAIEDRCAHQFAPLSRGRLCGAIVECALHGWRFHVRTGRPPAGEFPRVRAFPVRVEGGAVYVAIGGSSSIDSIK